MTAEDTARRVLRWATRGGGPLPEGALWNAAGLAAPGSETLALIADLARMTAARLGVGAPPFGDVNSVSLGAVLLAAAAGGQWQQPQRARALAQALPPSRPRRARPDEARWYDLIARHGVVSAVLAAASPDVASSRDAPNGLTAIRPRPAATAANPTNTDEPLTETLLRMSPVTAVLCRPPLSKIEAGTTAEETEAAAVLASQPRGLRVIAAALSRWCPDAAALTWRYELLTSLGDGNPDVMLDTYTMARLRYGDDWDTRLTWARRTLSSSGPPDPLAIATVRFWVPLARQHLRGVRLADVRPLLTGYRHALQLVGYYRLHATGAP